MLCYGKNPPINLGFNAIFKSGLTRARFIVSLSQFISSAAWRTEARAFGMLADDSTINSHPIFAAHIFVI